MSREGGNPLGGHTDANGLNVLYSKRHHLCPLLLPEVRSVIRGVLLHVSIGNQ
jgi:hypothetical protein